MNKNYDNIVSILVNVAVNEPYSYSVPDGKSVRRGTIVRVPLGARKQIGVVLGKPKNNIAHNRLRDIEYIYDCPPLREELLKTINWMAEYTLISQGMLLRSVLSAKKALEKEKPLLAYKLNNKFYATSEKKLTRARKKVLNILADGLAHTKRDLKERAMVSASVIDGLEKIGVIYKVEIDKISEFTSPNPNFAPLKLNKEQMKALKNLRKMDKGFGVALLDGVTGGGKTEIFFEKIADILREGRQILILLPEIALTDGFIERFALRFGAKAAKWHSEMSENQRAKIWRGVMNGSIRAVIGARSALFLPFYNLGLIVLDEEHDSAYKQSDGMNYHARHMAVIRAKFAGIMLILSSATPSLESRFNANIGKYKHIRIENRYSKIALPDVKIINMREEAPKGGKWVADELILEIKKNLQHNEQSLLFLNRRGYAPLTLCRACGYRFQCSNCSAWLVEHRFVHKLMCHHCGLEIKKPTKCFACGQTDSLVAVGPGVERIAQEMQEIFPDARQVVLSSDMGSGAALREKFMQIEQGEYDIIIGTQLVAKGHHFEKLTLVGVIDADLGLAQGDLRAAEKTFQILTQVSGRAGRVGKRGRAYLQTYHSENKIFKALSQHDSEGFYEHELTIRKEAGLPPYGRLAAMIISADKNEKAFSYARSLIAHAPKSSNVQDLRNLKIYGPAQAPISVLRGLHRVRILVQSEKNFNLSSYMRFWLDNAPKPKGGIKMQIDIEPMNFY